MSQNQESLTVSDLVLVKQVIDVACSRGAIKPAEMKVVGDLYERLDQFLSQLVDQSEPGLTEDKGEPNDA